MVIDIMTKEKTNIHINGFGFDSRRTKSHNVRLQQMFYITKDEEAHRFIFNAYIPAPTDMTKDNILIKNLRKNPSEETISNGIRFYEKNAINSMKNGNIWNNINSLNNTSDIIHITADFDSETLTLLESHAYLHNKVLARFGIIKDDNDLKGDVLPTHSNPADMVSLKDAKELAKKVSEIYPGLKTRNLTIKERHKKPSDNNVYTQYLQYIFNHLSSISLGRFCEQKNIPMIYKSYKREQRYLRPSHVSPEPVPCPETSTPCAEVSDSISFAQHNLSSYLLSNFLLKKPLISCTAISKQCEALNAVHQSRIKKLVNGQVRKDLLEAQSFLNSPRSNTRRMGYFKTKDIFEIVEKIKKGKQDKNLYSLLDCSSELLHRSISSQLNGAEEIKLKNISKLTDEQLDYLKKIKSLFKENKNLWKSGEEKIRNTHFLFRAFNAQSDKIKQGTLSTEEAMDNIVSTYTKMSAEYSKVTYNKAQPRSNPKSPEGNSPPPEDPLTALKNKFNNRL